LKSVERHVDRTGQDVRERGITAGHTGRGGERGAASNKKVSKSWVPGSALQKYLSDKDIRVEKAPTGMSRQKTNMTRVTNKGNVMWTVEWVARDGKKSVDSESSEGSQLKELWGEVIARRLNVEKGKKRKRESEKQSSTQPPNVQGVEQHTNTNTQTQGSLPLTGESELTARPSAPGGDVATDHVSNQQPEPSPSKEATDAQSTEVAGGLEGGNEAANAPAPEYFYLLRPFTASKSIVLTPIDSSKSLTECLQGQTVLEFPTIYVLPDEPDSLPTGFLLAEQYEKVQKAEEVEVDDLMQRTNQSTGGALTASREEDKPLDANSILDMLKRDVGV
jgi:hypothetical protein